MVVRYTRLVHSPVHRRNNCDLLRERGTATFFSPFLYDVIDVVAVGVANGEEKIIIVF